MTSEELFEELVAVFQRANKLMALIMSEDPTNDVTEITKSVKLEEIVTKYLKDMGIPAKLKGYSYIRTAIMMTIQNPELVSAVTKRLYPEIAAQYKTTSSRVERAIRHAIEVTFQRGNSEFLYGIFGNTISDVKDRPTNSEFIALLADEIRLKMKKNNLFTV